MMSSSYSPEFEKLSISTITCIISTNAQIDLDELFNRLEITPIREIKQKLKKREEYDEKIRDLRVGSIVSIKYRGNMKGTSLKPSKNKKTQFFKNSICIVMMLDKLINFKISSNGKFQVTGCLNIDHPKQLVKVMFDKMVNGVTFHTKDNEPLKVVIEPVMYNLSFQLNNIYIDRTELDKLCRSDDNKFISIYYANDDLFDQIQTLKRNFEKNPDLVFPLLTLCKDGSWVEDNVTLEYYNNNIKNITSKSIKKKDRIYRVSLMVHGKGKVIMSGFGLKHMKIVYNEFIEFVTKHIKRINIPVHNYS